ncbi:acyl-CoA dehydrogenase [Cryptosporangium aurantiacum]|uniref:Acyl-CoA dehydrogenase n=1 Tax=Cryptosporangium aurantiacum TaxID=134849 RepID=A0A1M7R4B1_9ACTN|nr:acyl-CoA dehydrogenase [Cryptosporangium aurantiacum]SHN39929.1 Acyl-CoA dehydrogenase [Cryptosporangium aurantiacum]
MSLAITADHRELADVVRSFAHGEGLRHETRGALDKLSAEPGVVWSRIGDLGWAGLHLPAEHGGSGYGLAELAVVLEALGATVASGPLLATTLASAVIDRVGTPDQRSALLPRLADGSTTASVGIDGGLLLGGVWARLHLVPSGEDLVVIEADAAGVVEAVGGLDPSLGLARLPAGAVTGEVLSGGVQAARTVLRTLAAAEAAGGARACLDMALDYAKVREQFGRPIGSFQAVKHHLANMLVRSEQAVAAAWDAARVVGNEEEAEFAAAVAAVIALDAYTQNARMNIQIHGGIGFTWEHDAHLYLRRATALAALAGAPDSAADDVAALSVRGVTRDVAVELPPEAELFRAEVRAFREQYANSAPGDRRRLLVDSGYLMAHWPKPWGRAAGPVEQLVIEQEFAEIDVPDLGIGGWVLLTLTQTARPDQIERWVRPGLLGDLTFCQLFSEPNAGSDAAAVQTRGVKVDGGWRVTGQKAWTSNAQNCNRGLATIRTDPAALKHKGVTTVVVDLAAPGVTVRPLREITGEAVFNEVFLDDVFIPDDDVVGEPGAGWAVARATLGNERVSIGGARNGSRRGTALDLIDLLAAHAPWDAGLSREVGRLIAAQESARLLNLRSVERAVVGAAPSVEGNMTKLLSAEQAQAIRELGMRIAGPAGVAGGEPELAHDYLFTRALTIAGGTSEVTRNVIAERILGLPREAVK